MLSPKLGGNSKTFLTDASIGFSAFPFEPMASREIMSSFHTTPVDSLANITDSPSHIALARDSLAFIEKEHVHILSGLGGVSSDLKQTVRLLQPPGRLLLSDSARFFGVISVKCERSPQPNRVTVWQTHSGDVVADFMTRDLYKMATEAAIVTLLGRETLIVSHVRSVLEAYDLETMERLLVSDFRGHAFRFDGFRSLGVGDLFIAFGHLPTEPKESLVVFSLRDLVARQDTEICVPREPGNEYASRAAAGPAGENCIVVFRFDHRDDVCYEQDEDRNEEEIDWFDGFYLRRLSDGAILERIAYVPAIESLAPVFALPGRIVCGCPDHIEIIGYAQEQIRVQSIPAHKYAFDTVGRRFVTISETGQAHLYSYLGSDLEE